MAVVVEDFVNKDLLTLRAKIVNSYSSTNWGYYMHKIRGGAKLRGESLPQGPFAR